MARNIGCYVKDRAVQFVSFTLHQHVSLHMQYLRCEAQIISLSRNRNVLKMFNLQKYPMCTGNKQCATEFNCSGVATVTHVRTKLFFKKGVKTNDHFMRVADYGKTTSQVSIQLVKILRNSIRSFNFLPIKEHDVTSIPSITVEFCLLSSKGLSNPLVKIY